MRFLHTADWHLGRQFYQASLIEDQAHVLDQLVDLAKQSRVDAVLVCGDVYDRALPPQDAVALLDETLERLVLDAKVSVLMIAGNHDSPERLGFGASLLRKQGCYISGPLKETLEPLVLEHEKGPVRFISLPYADPPKVRQVLEQPDLVGHDAAMAALTEQARTLSEAGERLVLLGHCWVNGGTSSESERPLSVGGAGMVGVNRFEGFDYVALGHLHRPQKVADHIHYSGSLLKYSFSEADHKKSVNLVEMDGSGSVTVERVALSPKRDVRIIEGFLSQILDGPGDGRANQDYLLVRLQDKDAILDAMGKLRSRYPNVLHLERPGLLQAAEGPMEGRRRLHHGALDLFTAFFDQVTGGPLSSHQTECLKDVLEEMQRVEREVHS